MAELHGSAALLVQMLFGGGGAGLLCHAAWSCVAGINSRSWPSTSGLVMVDDLQTFPSGRGGPTYRAEVSYKYTVEDKEYVADRVFFGDSIGVNASGPSVRRVAKYPVGSSVRVFYDPAQPSTAVLEPGINGLNWLELAMGLVFIAFGVLGALNAK